MNKEERRKRLNELLGKIVKAEEEIEEAMKDLKVRGGRVAHRSLKPRSGQFIGYTSRGIFARYRDEKGELYEIEISKRNENARS